jgi:RNA polymerase sigma-70 factor (ECF subfamily)
MNMNKLEKINQEDKFNKLFNDNYAKLKNVAFGMTRNSDDAEDILIVAYTNAWKKYEKGEFDENKKFMNWMNTIIRHCFIDFQRKKLRRPSSVSLNQTSIDSESNNISVMDFEDPNADIQAALEQSELYSQLRVELEKVLSDDLRDAISLFMQGMSYEEIAEYSGENTGTIRSRIFRAKKLLKKTPECVKLLKSYV